MRVPGRKFAIVGASLLALVLIAFIVHCRTGAPVTARLAAACRSLPVSADVSDMTIDGGRGVAYLAYLDRKPSPEGRPASGTIMLVDLNVAEPRVRAALVSDPPEFRPVAVSLYVSPQGARRLFVVDAAGSVHVFEQSPAGTLALLKTVHDPLLASSTAIAAVGPEQFYTTSRYGVVHFDGQRARTRGLRIGAGIAVSPDGRVMYVSERRGRRMQVFDRDPETGAIRPMRSIKLGSSPDHLSMDAEGTVWIAAHSRVLALSQDGRLSEIHPNDGSTLADATTVAARARQILIGSMSDPGFLLCQKE
jgi:arylesterase / paraoxonase